MTTVLNQVIHQIYYVIVAFFGLLLLRNLFFRKTRTSLIYDVVYAYTLIPFVLRVLHIK
ncbi:MULTISPECIES: hypothetical protein [Dethiosulfovibrio]|jgi:beta-xylosidase|uniref:Uncharacterized protein n=3 Tax=Dethiosulfovibrio TaxID=47054 RepID=D2Z587_9BACT|nr:MULTISPECIES: hypothetical protein [Dethiosulfovibrio]EFC90646.1 hypothetical protein Dpep_0618 [Dethiosulfovibrio peptidovorans DSM 11002]MCF4114604.1 hypothetical protein [Dethiosulfovibrio russensis]MCF4142828.1 hypothetical protein [Dethiosulfovibrio marinus]MCF4144843.1 hypothetical protein [Dethiosulfovibrio acidaminovorans]MCF4151611.1 hypothetical protein [Dethiosulfovibrio faecalis]